MKVPSDVVKGVFHFIGSGKKFEANIPKIHEFFYDMSVSDEELSELMADFIFEESRSFHFSKTVSFALDRLQKANLLNCNNPKLDTFEISDRLSDKKVQEQMNHLFGENECVLLQRAADSFKCRFGI